MSPSTLGGKVSVGAGTLVLADGRRILAAGGTRHPATGRGVVVDGLQDDRHAK